MSDKSALDSPHRTETNIRRVAILFAGGPAPAANAVISAAATSFLRADIQVFGIRNGYSNLVQYSEDRPLAFDKDYCVIDNRMLRRTRNSQGIMIGTARANPGKHISSPAHLEDPERCQPLKSVYEALCSLDVDALISIGGDDTLKTANKMKMYQDRLPTDARRIPVVHLPKTIDNDYSGIDFTFGYFTAVDTLASEIRNLLADAESTNSYFLAETMGRSAGWLAYGAGIAGEASLTVSVEDITGRYRDEETTTNPETGEQVTRPIMKVNAVVNRIVATMRAREEKEGKLYGVIVMAEGLAEYLPSKELEGIARDEHGHINIAKVDLGRMFAHLVADEYERQAGHARKVTGLQLGYESRCARPNAFDVMLGSQLGVGAFRALVEQGLNGVMVSVTGQLDLNYVPFENLVDPDTLVTNVRYVDPDCDFHKLIRFLETHVHY
ncbi:MAG: 6-phosphofructokinase [Planctomycetales bacterium]|nr:6-phosphofructokinase [Planctomycetales bacterium]